MQQRQTPLSDDAALLPLGAAAARRGSDSIAARRVARKSSSKGSSSSSSSSSVAAAEETLTNLNALDALRLSSERLDECLPAQHRGAFGGVLAQLERCSGTLDPSVTHAETFKALAHRYQAAAYQALDDAFTARRASSEDIHSDAGAITLWNDDVKRLGWWDERMGGVRAWSNRAQKATTTAQVACILYTMWRALTPETKSAKIANLLAVNASPVKK